MITALFCVVHRAWEFAIRGVLCIYVYIYAIISVRNSMHSLSPSFRSILSGPKSKEVKSTHVPHTGQAKRTVVVAMIN